MWGWKLVEHQMPLPILHLFHPHAQTHSPLPPIPTNLSIWKKFFYHSSSRTWAVKLSLEVSRMCFVQYWQRRVKFQNSCLVCHNIIHHWSRCHSERREVIWKQCQNCLQNISFKMTQKQRQNGFYLIILWEKLSFFQ